MVISASKKCADESSAYIIGTCWTEHRVVFRGYRPIGYTCFMVLPYTAARIMFFPFASCDAWNSSYEIAQLCEEVCTGSNATKANTARQLSNAFRSCVGPTSLAALPTATNRSVHFNDQLLRSCPCQTWPNALRPSNRWLPLINHH